jgi:hypothetical protein
LEKCVWIGCQAYRWRRYGSLLGVMCLERALLKA